MPLIELEPPKVRPRGQSMRRSPELFSGSVVKFQFTTGWRISERTPAGLPIAVSLDFHANFSSELIRNATVIAGYCTYPHVDIYETGEHPMGEVRPLTTPLAPVKR